MTARTDVIADELLNHKMQAGGTCRCGRRIRLGSSIQVHRAQAVQVAVSLAELGVPAAVNHELTMKLLANLDALGVSL